MAIFVGGIYDGIENVFQLRSPRTHREELSLVNIYGIYDESNTLG